MSACKPTRPQAGRRRRICSPQAKEPADIVTDLKLLKSLYDKKLANRIAELKAEGWKWVEYQSELGYNAQFWDGKGKNGVKADERGNYGVLISIDYHGIVEFKYGIQKPAAKAAADKKKAVAKGGPAESAISAALAGRISTQITTAAETVLALDPDLGLAVIAAALTSSDGPVCITHSSNGR